MEITISPTEIQNIYFGTETPTTSTTCVRIRNSSGTILWSRKDTARCTFKLRDSKDESVVL